MDTKTTKRKTSLGCSPASGYVADTRNNLIRRIARLNNRRSAVPYRIVGTRKISFAEQPLRPAGSQLAVSAAEETSRKVCKVVKDGNEVSEANAVTLFP